MRVGWFDSTAAHLRSHHLVIRMLPSQGRNTGLNPVGITKRMIDVDDYMATTRFALPPVISLREIEWCVFCIPEIEWDYGYAEEGVSHMIEWFGPIGMCMRCLQHYELGWPD